MAEEKDAAVAAIVEEGGGGVGEVGMTSYLVEVSAGRFAVNAIYFYSRNS